MRGNRDHPSLHCGHHEARKPEWKTKRKDDEGPSGQRTLTGFAEHSEDSKAGDPGADKYESPRDGDDLAETTEACHCGTYARKQDQRGG